MRSNAGRTAIASRARTSMAPHRSSWCWNRRNREPIHGSRQSICAEGSSLLEASQRGGVPVDADLPHGTVDRQAVFEVLLRHHHDDVTRLAILLKERDGDR